ncbi:MAG TPA: GTPase Era, partial [Gammaproteobacteria bacterium]|nr:GTPase Era [Gammaproteobacteria bacterium]
LIYPEDQITDRSMRFLAAEMVREKFFRQLGQELPYSLTVEIEQYEEEASLLRIGAVIYVERQGQKAIVIGKKGGLLKTVGREARIELEKIVEKKVFLTLWVKVRDGWSDNDRILKSLGYHDDVNE